MSGFADSMIIEQRAPGLVALTRRSGPMRRLRPELDRIKDRIPAQILAAFKSCGRGESAWPLFISGAAGCGKTRAALYLCDWVQGDCKWRDASDLAAEFADLKCGRLPANGRCDAPMSLAAWREEFYGFALCVIDEIGARRTVSDTAYESIKAVLDIREGRPLLLLSNLDLEQIATVFDDRIASRCAAGCVVMVGGCDQRLQA